MKSEGESTTNLTTWQDKLVVSGTLEQGEGGQYMLWGYCELTGTVTNRRVRMRIIIDGDPKRGPIYFTPSSSDEWMPWSPSGGIELTDGFHELKLQYVSEHPAQTAKIRHASIIIMKH